MPKYLYLNDPGSRWELADDVDIVVLRQRLADARSGTLQTEVLVDGLRGPLTIRRDQLFPHAVVQVAEARPARRR